MKVLYVASEAYPFAMSGGLADVAGALPKALRNKKMAARVVLPLYDTINPQLRENMKFIKNITVPVAWRNQYCGIFESKVGRVIYYLIDNEYYFKRGGLYGYHDDAERYTFFSRAVLEMLKHIDFKPDILHCNDWQTAMVPIFHSLIYARQDEFYKSIKTLFTIHNIQYQGKFGKEIFQDVLGLDPFDAHIIEYEGCVNLMKGAIECAHAVSTVSPTYAKEILDPWYSHGLDGILKERQFKLYGIINGIDTDVYNPETDSMIYKNFSQNSLENKRENRKELLKELNLPEGENAVIGIVTRLVGHKGLDLIKHTFEDMVKMGVQFVILGSGDREYEMFFYEMAKKYPDKVAHRTGFIPALAHKIYAGADIFLMPSKSEPCGLAQMVALRYGTIPIVRETGGLSDTISDSANAEGNGFTFKNYNAHDMAHTVWRAVEGFNNKEGWATLVARAMACDNSWGNSANEYIKLYETILNQ